MDDLVRQELTAHFPAINWSWNAPPPPPPETDLLYGLQSVVTFRQVNGKTIWGRGGGNFAVSTEHVATPAMYPFIHNRGAEWTIAYQGGAVRVGATVIQPGVTRSHETPLPVFSAAEYVYATTNVRDLCFWNRILTDAEKAAWLANPVYPFDGTPLPSIGNGQPIKVVALWGQSNVQGLSPITAPMPWNPDCPMYPAQAGIPCWRASTAPAYGNITTFGPEATLGDGLGAGYAVVKFGIGGTKIATDWKAGTGPLYQQSKAALQTALSELTGAGYVPTVHAVLWMQGLSDAKLQADANAFQQNITDFFAAVRADWGASLPIVYSRIPQGVIGLPAWPYGQQIRNAHEAIAGGLNLMQNFDGYTFLADQIHYDAPSMKQAGYDMASVIGGL